eukprot:999121-Pyramimonas_sp.AAC.1
MGKQSAGATTSDVAMGSQEGADGARDGAEGAGQALVVRARGLDEKRGVRYVRETLRDRCRDGPAVRAPAATLSLR